MVLNICEIAWQRRKICGVCNCFLRHGKSKANVRLETASSFCTFQHIPPCPQNVVRITNKRRRNVCPEPQSSAADREATKRRISLVFLHWDLATVIPHKAL